MIPAALRLLAVDPQGLGGAVLQGPAGPEREALLAAFDGLLPAAWPRRRIPVNATTDRLFGGLDLAQTQASGRPVYDGGLISAARGGVLVLPMAERASAGVVTALLQLLDGEPPAALLALDESLPEEAALPAALRDRLAFALPLDARQLRTLEWRFGTAEELAAARVRYARLRATDPQFEALAHAALAFGVGSSRAELLALRAARAAAALAGREQILEADLALAVELVLVPRATRLPVPPAPPPEQEAPPPPENGESEEAPIDGKELADRLLAAAAAALPPELLATLAAPRKGAGTGRGGRMVKTPTHGRRLGSRPGDPRRTRIDLIDTLRAAAPWQRLRTRVGGRLAIRRDDFRVQRLEHQGGSTVIFVVDASGSAALHRLAEAKGAVELLLAESYVRRDRVALVSFRGATADLILPPTRSLARARRTLAGLPGGGGTPLATALVTAQRVAEQVGRERDGGSALVVLLTDARANVALDGTGGRPAAEADAETAAMSARAELKEMVKSITDRRLAIQLAADAEWTHKEETNAAIRKEFALSAKRALMV